VEGQLITPGLWLYQLFSWLSNDTRLGTLKIRLFTNELAPSPALTIADLIPPTYTGYTDSPARTMLAVGINSSGDAYYDLSPFAFTPSDAVSPALIRGWAVWDDAPFDQLAAVFIFDEPVMLADQYDTLIVQPRLMLGQPLSPNDHV